MTGPRRLALIAISFILFLVALRFVVGRKHTAQAAATPGGRPPALVNVATAVEREAPIYLDEIGKATAREMVTIMPQVAGKINALHFVDGADLKKGDLLFTIDARPFQAVLDQTQGQLAKDEAASVNAERFLKRQQDIFKQGFVSPSDYDTAQFNSKAAKAALEADKATIEAARLNVEYCTIRSPIDGRAGARLVDPGNVVKIDETPLLVIQRIEPIYADFTINERELAGVRAAMADHTLKTLVKLPTDTITGEEGEYDVSRQRRAGRQRNDQASGDAAEQGQAFLAGSVRSGAAGFERTQGGPCSNVGAAAWAAGAVCVRGQERRNG